MWTLILFSCLLGVLVILWFQKSRAKLPPGPRGLPLVGYLPFLDPKSPYKTFSDLVSDYGKVYSIKLGNILCIVVADDDVIRSYFSKVDYSGRAQLYVTHGIMEGQGLISAEGEVWKRNRHFMVDYMRKVGMSRMTKSNQALHTLEQRILNCIQDCFQGLKDQNNDLDDILSHGIGNMLNEIIFGISYHKHDPVWIKMQRLREEGIKELGVSQAVNFLPWLSNLPKIKSMMKWIKEGQRLTHQEYARLQDQVSPDSMTQAFLDARDQRSESDQSKYFSDRQLHFLQADIFGAGLDTTLTIIKWCILYLCQYPQVQEELFLSLAQNEAPIGLDLRKSSKDIESFLLEVQRLRPVVPVGVPHATVCETKLLDWTVPKDTMIMPLLWHLNRDPTLWTDPDEFIPDRFINNNDEIEVPRHFLPFQYGLRKCIGEEFGQSMLFLFMANFIRNYKVSIYGSYDFDREPLLGFTLSPHPFKVNLLKR